VQEGGSGLDQTQERSSRLDHTRKRKKAAVDWITQQGGTGMNQSITHSGEF